MYYFYIIQSEVQENYYLGQTSSLRKRLRAHQKGHNSSTKHISDWILVYWEEYETRSEAIKREKQVKSWKKRARTESLMRRSH